MRVYAIATATAVKIGVSNNPPKRLRTLQTGATDKLRLVHSIEHSDARLVERLAHDMLKDKHTHGEWFRVSEDEAVGAISRAVSEIASAGDVCGDTVTRFEMRASADWLKFVDDWRRKQPDLPPRAETIRRLVDLGLKKDQ